MIGTIFIQVHICVRVSNDTYIVCLECMCIYRKQCKYIYSETIELGM